MEGDSRFRFARELIEFSGVEQGDRVRIFNLSLDRASQLMHAERMELLIEPYRGDYSGVVDVAANSIVTELWAKTLSPKRSI